MNIQNSPQIIEHINYPLDNTIYDVKWVDGKSDIIAVGEELNKRGFINLYNLNKGDFTCVSMNKTERGIKTVCPFYSYSGSYTIACGSFDGRILLYDINNMSKEYYAIKKHTKLINKIDCKSHKNNNLIVSGSRDGSVKIFDIRTNREVVSLQPPKGSAYTPDCWCVATGGAISEIQTQVPLHAHAYATFAYATAPISRCIGNNHIEENPLCGERQENMNICAGYDNGDIKFFDIKTMTLEYEVNAKKHNSTRLFQQNEIVHLYDRKDTQKNKLICSTLEGNIYIFNLDVYSEETGYAYSKDQIISGTCWGTPFLPQNRDIFAALGGDGNVKIEG
ncbi:WD repeat-containing protein 92, putative (WDR92) [Plasmodium ovale wallikeri]|uniref:WD repeat-containing protein 92, putative (WDR92) n=1 Tax=Plasmodium ovale wallikeri TaxID=864142 RepID=A0A1A8Z9F2_PLAOA|nr:WD repeat-containing protein 92, putative (WDR92) [Plasmodium ovale wallikeri]